MIRTKLIIDELFQVHVEELDNALAATRKFGLDLVLCVNDIPQLKSLYPHTFDSVLSSCSVKQWMNAVDPTSSEYVSSLCGEREVMTFGKTVNTNPLYDPAAQGSQKLGVSDSKNISTRRLILPHEVRNLKPGEQIVTIRGVENPIRCNRESYLNIPELVKKARPNPFYYGNKKRRTTEAS